LRHNVEFAVKLFQHCAANHALEVPSAMRAIPIDVLRAFVAVVDSRGFTRAAEDLGRTQPTVSLQVKRLEELIEAPLFEKASRLILTRSGEICLDYGRKILAQHDEMLDFVVRQRSGSDPIRLGMPSEFAAFLVPNLASLTRRDGQRLHFDFTCEMSETLLDRLRANQLDVALALMSDGGAEDAVAEWRLPMGWISAPGYQAPKDSPVQLITTPERSLYYQIATAALHRAGRKFEIVCKSANFDVLKTAVDSGFGVSAIAKGLAPKGSRLVPCAQIAGLPDVTLGLFARAGGASPPSRPLVEHMIDVLSTSPALGHT
jgi:DNA-binding transcriptional LysR family regulator